jgi:hypothetical protein
MGDPNEEDSSMNLPAYPWGNGSLGAIIAIIVLIVALCLYITDEIGKYLAGFVIALAIARLT